MGKYIKDYQIQEFSDEKVEKSKKPKKFKDSEDLPINKKKFKKWKDS